MGLGRRNWGCKTGEEAQKANQAMTPVEALGLKVASLLLGSRKGV